MKDAPGQPPNPNLNKKWIYISAGCLLFAVAGIILLVIVGILIAVAIPRFSNVTQTAQGAVAKDVLSQLNSAASIYTAEQETAPTGFTDFVTNEAIGTERTKYVLSLKNIGNTESENLCEITPATITCPNGPDSKFPKLPGPVTYAFNQGVNTFTVSCDGGSSPPEHWNSESCSIDH